jgi:hypothetical protein
MRQRTNHQFGPTERVPGPVLDHFGFGSRENFAGSRQGNSFAQHGTPVAKEEKPALKMRLLSEKILEPTKPEPNEDQ